MPGGFQEYGEHPTSTAIREVVEETGLNIEITQILGIYVETMPDASLRQIVAFVATLIDGRLRVGDDANKASWFPLSKLPENVIPYHLKRIDDYKTGMASYSKRILSQSYTSS